MPSFVIDFAAAKWDFITFELLQSKFVSGDVFIPNVESIHYKSDKDPLYSKLFCQHNFENPIVIEFDGGHRPPKILNEQQLQITTNFLTK